MTMDAHASSDATSSSLPLAYFGGVLSVMGRETYSRHIRRAALTRTIREHFSSERRNRFSDRVIELWEARHARGAQAPRPRAV